MLLLHPLGLQEMILNDEHVQPHLFPVLTSKKLAALCFEHPNTRSVPEAQGALILAPLFLHADCEEDNLITKNCALCEVPNFTKKKRKKKKKCYVVKGHRFPFHSALTLPSSADNYFFLESQRLTLSA